MSPRACAPRRAVAAVGLVLAGCGGPATASDAVPSGGPTSDGPTSGAASTLTAPPTPYQGPDPKLPHLMVVVLENREYADVIGSPRAPRINALAAAHGLATQAYGIRHPSEPNYVAMITGDTQGIRDDSPHVVDAPSLPLQMSQAGVGWRAYMGGMPSACDRAVSAGKYAQKHNPYIMIRAVADDPALCRQVVPQSQLAEDLGNGTAPSFMFVAPNLCDDGHDCDTGTADASTGQLVDQVTASAWYRQGGVIVLTWDEGSSNDGCCDGAAGGHVPLVVVSDRLPAGTTLDSPVDHAGMLRAIEELYSLPLLGRAGSGASGDLMPLIRPAR